MLTQPRRLISAAIAVLLGVAFVAAALGVGAALSATVERSARTSIGDAAVVVSPTQERGRPPADPVSGAYVDAARALPGVTAVKPLVSTFVMQQTSGQIAATAAETTPEPGGTARVTAGRLPSAPGEVAVNQALAENRHVAVGAEIRFSNAGTAPPASSTARVVGILAPGPGMDGPGMPTVYAANADLLTWAGRTPAAAYDDVLLLAAPGTDATALAAAARALPGAGTLTVRTAPEEIAARVATMDSGSGAFTGMLLAFAAISVLVSSLVIANTFAIVVAQRVRELALLRCVGATRRQVFRSVLRDAAVMALVASAAGLALGLGAVALLVRVTQGSPMELAGVSVTPTGVGVPLLVGLLVTLAAAALPARRATAVAPLAAMRPEVALGQTRRAGRLRTMSGLLLAVLGTAGLVVGAVRHDLLTGLAGGAASLVGIVLLGQLITPLLARLLGVPARLRGLPGRLAVDNARRNPARAAATASALFVGVTLITLMSVGAASGQASVSAELDRHMPVDAMVVAPQGLSQPAEGRLRRAVDVAAVSRVDTLPVQLEAPGRPTTTQPVLGLPRDIGRVVRTAGYAAPADDVIVLDTALGVAEGTPVTLRSGAQQVTLRAAPKKDADPTVAATALARLLPDEVTKPAPRYWVRFVDGADGIRATERLREVVAGESGVQVESAAAQRAEYERVIQITLYVVTGLLGVAVVIALVGVGNTLGLSVLERTRETGLLRALGVTRRQVRGMLGIEALVLAGVGTVLGIAVGIGYGVAGAHALLGEALDVVVAIPWGRLALVAVIALAAGWLASVLPGHRAAQVPPSAALAAE